MLTSVAGDGFVWRFNEIVEVDDETARVWCDGERAVLYEEPAPRRRPIEAAVRAAPEDMAARRSKGR